MEFSSVGNHIRVRMKKENGSSFYGSLTLPTTSNNRTTQFVPVRRVLRVNLNTTIGVGDVFFTTKGDGFLTVDNGEVESRNSNLKTYLAVPLTKKVKWQRKTVKIDPITGMKTDDVLQDLGDIWIACEYKGAELDSLRVDKSIFRIVTGADVLCGDLLDGNLTVNTSNKTLGVTLLYAG